jgi:hypothetical protein
MPRGGKIKEPEQQVKARFSKTPTAGATKQFFY